MSLDTLFNAKVTITRRSQSATARDTYNMPIGEDYVLAENVPCWFEFSAFSPLGSFESPERREIRIGRETVLIDARMVLPKQYFNGYDTVDIIVDATDGITLTEHGGEPHNEAFEVLGPPSRITVPRGKGFTELNLRRITG